MVGFFNLQGAGRLAFGSFELTRLGGRYIPALSALARFYASKCKLQPPITKWAEQADFVSVSVAFPPHTVVSMPALSPTMTAGNIGTWQKKPGDTIAPGDVLVEIETDKAQMDFEFQEDGVLAKILKESGEKDVAVGNVSRNHRWDDLG